MKLSGWSAWSINFTDKESLSRAKLARMESPFQSSMFLSFSKKFPSSSATTNESLKIEELYDWCQNCWRAFDADADAVAKEKFANSFLVLA